MKEHFDTIDPLFLAKLTEYRQTLSEIIETELKYCTESVPPDSDIVRRVYFKIDAEALHSEAIYANGQMFTTITATLKDETITFKVERLLDGE